MVEEVEDRGSGKEGRSKQDALMQSFTKFLDRSDLQTNSQLGETLALCQTMMKELREERAEGGKRKVEEEKVKEEEFQLVELSGLTYKDDQNTTLDWAMRRLVKPIAADPEEYWKPTSENKETYPRVCKPALGTNWYLDHVMTNEIAASTVLAASDSGTFLEVDVDGRPPQQKAKKDKNKTASNPKKHGKEILSFDLSESSHLNRIIEFDLGIRLIWIRLI